VSGGLFLDDPQSPDSHEPGVPVALAVTGTPAHALSQRVDVQKVAAPPSSNTGAQNTAAVRVTPDYLSWTFPSQVPLHEALALIEGCNPLDWTPTERGGNGYRQGLAHGEMRVFYDGNADMGVFVQLRGRGYHQFAEANELFSEEAIRSRLAGLKEHGASFTRFDLAFDDVDAHLIDLAEVRRSVEEARVVSRFRTADPSGKVDLASGRRVGDVIHFGSIMSEVSVCFYDKAAQQAEETGNAAWEAFHWVRCELRTKKERAQAAVESFITGGAQRVAQVLYGYLDFKEAGQEDTNRSRWPTISWWAAFLEGCDKARLAVQNVARTLERARAWIEEQVAPTLAMLLESRAGLGWLRTVLKQGKGRMNRVHRSLLAADQAGDRGLSEVSAFVQSVAQGLSPSRSFCCSLCGAQSVSPSSVRGVCHHCESGFDVEITAGLACLGVSFP
jgi:hypothetical protein